MYWIPSSMPNQPSKQSLNWRRLYLSRSKLKATGRTSALLAGFAMVAMVELQIDFDTNKEDTVFNALIIAFTFCSTLLVLVHLFALLISVCLVPHIEAVSNVYNVNAVNESPHDSLHAYIETAWICSTLVGIVLFILEIIFLCWVKFYNYKVAAWVATGVCIPVLVILCYFGLHFYRILVKYKYYRSTNFLEELENMATQLDNDNHILQV